MTPPVFPGAEDDGCQPFRDIARWLDCNEDQALDAFRGLAVPEWEAPEHLKAVKDTTHDLNKAAQLSRNLLQAIRRMHFSQIDSLRHAGAATPEQIEHLHAVLSGHARNLSGWLRSRDRTGGRNPAAYKVAEGMRRLFRRLRKKITYGQSASGDPSTEFARAVEFALGAFGINAGWQGPARAAFKRQGEIASRMNRCALRKGFPAPVELDLDGVEIAHEKGENGGFYTISLTTQPQIPPFRVPGEMVGSGRAVQELAAEWLSRSKDPSG